MASANSLIPDLQPEQPVVEELNRRDREVEAAVVRPNRAKEVAVAEEAAHNPEAVVEEAELHLYGGME